MRVPVNTVAVRMALLALGGALLAACGGERAATPAAVTPALESVVVGEAQGAGGATWDATVQAVRAAALSAQTSGRIERVDVDVDDRIAAGQLLLRITAVEQAASQAGAQATLRAAEAQAVEAEARHRRARELVDQQLVSRQDYEQVKAARDSAVAAREAAAAQLRQVGQQLAYTTVRAPFAGVVSRRHVEAGETVSPGQALLDVYAPDGLRVEAQVPEGAAQAIRAAPAARVELRDGRSIDAGSVVVYPSADPASHSVTVRATLPALDNPPRPGETVRIVFPDAGDAAQAGAPWIPVAAVVRRGELIGVYVLAQDGILLRQLRVGRQQGGRVEVISGLSPGERIAADPVAALQALRAGQAGGSQAGGGGRE